MSSVSTRAGLIVAAVVAAVAWPFVAIQVPSDDIGARIEPSATFDILSHRRGEAETARYEIHNGASKAIALRIAAQSCACFSIRVEPQSIAPGESAVVTASGRTPMTGVSVFEFNILASEVGLRSDEPRREDMLNFKFRIVAMQDAILEAHPAALSYPARAWRSGVSPVVTLRLRADCPPEDVSASAGELGELSVEPLGDWTSDSFGVLSRRVRVKVPAVIGEPPGSLKFSLRLFDSGACDVVLPCLWKG
jgi:hypothetical protein